VIYVVTAADNSTATYTVTVIVAQSSAKAISAYSLAGVTGTINEAAKTISVTMPNGTAVTALVATFSTTGVNASVGAAVQTSGTTANNFSSPVTYKVTAADSSTANYTVTVIVAQSSAKALTAYSLEGVTGTINEAAKTISVTMPSGTAVTALVATFSTTGVNASVGATVQASGTTANNFSSPVVYAVTAADNSSVSYTVTVTVAQSSAKAISAYSLAGVTGTINEAAKTISVSLPNGSAVTALVATFTTTGASANVGAAVQTSGTSANDFTNPVAYTVTAVDSTTAIYTVTVSVAAASGLGVNLGTAGNYVILSEAGVTNVPASVITGDIGVSPIAATAITGFSLIADASGTFSTSTQVVGNIYAADYAVPTSSNLTTAVLDMQAAYTDAAGRAATSAATTNVGAGILTGLTLSPGVYEWGTAVTIPTDLVLNGTATDVWIFKVAGTLDLAAAKSILLSGGALPKNIFWHVSGAVTIGTTAHLEGVVLSATAITLQTGASANSRLLAQTAVALDSNAVTQPAP
jgi:Fe-S cluster assembly iron-binding protein IscA